MAEQATRQWCEERGHPWLTYNPWLGRSYCRCGSRQADGEKPHDWRADHELFHDHAVDEPCRCYLPAASSAGA